VRFRLIRRQDISVLLFYYLGYSRIRNLVFRLRSKPVARFVMFHDLLPETISKFKANLKFLKQKTNVVSLDDFFEGRLSIKKFNVVITFDDGFKSWVSHAAPILKELGLPATFFVSSGFVGLSMEDETEFIRSNLLLTQKPHKISGSLNFEDVRRIADEGFNIGGHTLTHCNMGKITDINRLRYEIAEDKKRLEKITGKKIEYFSYPFGAYDNPEINLVKMLKLSGYKGAVTTVSGFNYVFSNPFMLKRETTNAAMTMRVFRSRALGNYEPVLFLKQMGRMVFQRRFLWPN
jgi:peptidoglycan/xylan/chitin deacetylase (PgdA/CDA1 family)